MDRRVHDLFFRRLGGREFLDDPALPADQDAVGEVHDLGQVGRDHDHREPSSASRLMSSWISAMAPTSTPRVGSSKMIRRGCCTSPLPITTFCWLPPESSTTLASSLMARIAQRFRPLAGQGGHLPHADIGKPLETGREQAGIEILGDRHGLEEAFDLAVLGDIDDAVLHRLAGHIVAHRPAVELDVAAVQEIALVDAGDDLEGLGAAGADQAEHAGDLAGEDRERVVAHHRAMRDVLHRQELVAGRAQLICRAAGR